MGAFVGKNRERSLMCVCLSLAHVHNMSLVQTCVYGQPRVMHMFAMAVGKLSGRRVFSSYSAVASHLKSYAGEFLSKDVS